MLHVSLNVSCIVRTIQTLHAIQVQLLLGNIESSSDKDEWCKFLL